jgi:hypothetical protein
MSTSDIAGYKFRLLAMHMFTHSETVLVFLCQLLFPGHFSSILVIDWLSMSAGS